MLVLQRWQPTISRSFPSEILFWIQVTRIPVHLWTEELIQSIGEDIRTVEHLDVSSIVARMRVCINGLQPLVKIASVEFKNEEEIEVELVYERLKKYCKLCYGLDHDDKDCPSIKITRNLPLLRHSSQGRNDRSFKHSEDNSRSSRRDTSAHGIHGNHSRAKDRDYQQRESRSQDLQQSSRKDFSFC
ncbi:PREDICTED: uncharacterized protein At4g02000-like [Camelina sativa]|uniref:Uncharacterized protein At4g02000-like n=1 Tax=Camelina sativa TaxID=90675 RepID=A0ABM0TT30_CAMSA|nr:PREDICTED: uncharacterized protein At4g02000-like [Camelina sativa]